MSRPVEVHLEPGDVAIIRKFLEAKMQSEYRAEWTDQQLVDELTNWLYYNT